MTSQIELEMENTALKESLKISSALVKKLTKEVAGLQRQTEIDAYISYERERSDAYHAQNLSDACGGLLACINLHLTLSRKFDIIITLKSIIRSLKCKNQKPS